MSLMFWVTVIQNIPYEFIELGGDSAQYIILAESLCQGKGYKAVNYPGEPFFYHYPPVFPLLLSPIIYFFGRNIYLMHIWVAFLGYISLFFLYCVFKKYTEGKWAFFLVCIFATNGVLIMNSSECVLSDIPYLFFSSFTLFMCTKYLEEDGFFNKEGFLTLCGLVLSYFTRYAAVALFLGILCILVSQSKQKRFKKAGFILVGFIVPVFLWQITYKILNPAALTKYYYQQFFLIDYSAPYLGTLFEHPQYIFSRFVEGVNYYYHIITSVFLFHFINIRLFIFEVVSILAFIFILLGVWLQFRKDKYSVFQYYFLIYSLLMIFCPYREGDRFFLPVLPIIFFYFFSALKEISKLLFQKKSSLMLHVFFSIFFISNIWFLVFYRPFSFHSYPSYLKNFISLHKWVRYNLPKEGVFFSYKPTVTYFYTGHQAILYPYTFNPEEIWGSVIKNNVKYIIVEGFSKETVDYLLPFIYKYKDRLEVVYSIEYTILFKVRDS